MHIIYINSGNTAFNDLLHYIVITRALESTYPARRCPCCCLCPSEHESLHSCRRPAVWAARSMALIVVDTSGQYRNAQFMDITKPFKETGGRFFANSDTLSGLRVSQMPRSSKVAFFVLTTDRQWRQTKLIAWPLAHARGVIIYFSKEVCLLCIAWTLCMI